MENKKKGMYQVRRVQLDIREKDAKFSAETTLNSILNELQSNSNIEIIEMTEQAVDKNQLNILIKYWDFGLNN